MQDIDNRIDALEQKMDEILKSLTAFKIDRQLMIQRDTKIKAGVACKVAYNSDGLIVGVQPLSSADIPSIPMDKIKGLEDAVQQFATMSQIDTVNKRIDDLHTHTATVKTGTKVNVDSRGMVNDVADLVEDDIPVLSIEKIKGLRETLDELKLSLSHEQKPDKLVQAGTGCKIEYDNQGRVIRSLPLQEEDIPHTIISRLNELETKVSTKASTEDVEHLTDELSKKSDKISTVPGIYHKVQVNSVGQVVSGSDISLDDMEDIPMTKVTDLHERLSSTVSNDAFVDLMNRLASLESKLNKVSESISSIPTTRSTDTSSSLTSRIEEIVNRLDAMSTDTSVNDEIANLKSDIAELSARVRSDT